MWTWPFAADSFDNLQCWQVKYVNKYVNMARMMSDAISLSSASDPDEFYDAEDSTPIRNVRYKNTVCRRQITKKECQKSDKSLHLQVTLSTQFPNFVSRRKNRHSYPLPFLLLGRKLVLGSWSECWILHVEMSCECSTAFLSCTTVSSFCSLTVTVPRLLPWVVVREYWRGAGGWGWMTWCVTLG